VRIQLLRTQHTRLHLCNRACTREYQSQRRACKAGASQLLLPSFAARRGHQSAAWGAWVRATHHQQQTRAVQFVRQLLSHNNRILAGVRKPDRCEELRGLKAKHSKALSIGALDVADSGSIAEWAASVAERCEYVDVRVVARAAFVCACAALFSARVRQPADQTAHITVAAEMLCSTLSACGRRTPLRACSVQLHTRLRTHLSEVPQQKP
jgi:hypothetical protein